MAQKAEVIAVSMYVQYCNPRLAFIGQNASMSKAGNQGRQVRQAPIGKGGSLGGPKLQGSAMFSHRMAIISSN